MTTDKKNLLGLGMNETPTKEDSSQWFAKDDIMREREIGKALVKFTILSFWINY